MLVIDENMFRLARMQETLLKVSTSNRKENLTKYIDTVSEIDANAFKYIIDEVGHINEHNQSLEDELSFLEIIRNTYNQLVELQSNFKKNCEIYGDIELQLSDLSYIDIEYIENRINAIRGYLSNLKDIEDFKNKLEKLNEQLLIEQKKKISLDSRLEELEVILRRDFGSVEGRRIVDGKLEYTSVISEYEKIGFDYERLISDNEYLRSLLAQVNNEKSEIAEKVKVAEVCYNSLLNSESKQILDEINIEYLKIKYKLTMLEIINLLVKECNDYSSFVDKRKSMNELMKYRIVCMESLGINVSIDPFGRTKVKEQLDSIKDVEDNSNIITSLMKEIANLNSSIESMMSQNNGYLIIINDMKNLVIDKTSFNDIDITPTVSFDEFMINRRVEDNQVVRVRSISSKFKMGIVRQKTASVIKRVNEMMNPVIVQNDFKIKTNKSEVVPELVIVPVEPKKEEESLFVKPIFDFSVPVDADSIDKIDGLEINNKEASDDIKFAGSDFDFKIDEDDDLEFDNNIEDEKEESFVSNVSVLNEDLNLFETVTPFEEPSFFVNKLEESDNIASSNPVDKIDFDKIEFESKSSSLELPMDEGFDEMPDVFWVTQDDSKKDESDEDVKEPTFDEQISALLSFENNDNGKIRKKVA